MAERFASPFTPGYGKKPLVFGGHEAELDELTAVFETLDFGENHSVLVSGLRGTGKTSMLAELHDLAAERGWVVIRDDAGAGLLERVMDSTIPGLVEQLDRPAKTRLKALGVWQFNAQWEPVARQREIRPLLRNDLVALSRAIDDRGILITVDEVSSGKVRLRELSKFAREVSYALADGATIMIVFAGVRVDLDELIKQDHTTFLRRSRDIEFARLSPQETQHVLRETIRIGGRRIDDDALRRLTEIAQGYPYLVQLVGDYAWRADPTDDRIQLQDAEVAFERAIKAVTSRVISKVYLDLSEKDREFVRAMTESLDTGKAKMSRIVQRMGESDQYVQVYKRRLIESGYVQKAGHGYVSFSLPYLDQYVRTLIADEQPDGDDGTAPDDWAAFPAPQL